MSQSEFKTSANRASCIRAFVDLLPLGYPFHATASATRGEKLLPQDKGRDFAAPFYQNIPLPKFCCPRLTEPI